MIKKEDILNLIKRNSSVIEGVEVGLTQESFDKIISTGIFGDKKVIKVETPAFLINPETGELIDDLIYVNSAIQEDGLKLETKPSKVLLTETMKKDFPLEKPIEFKNGVEIVYLYDIFDHPEVIIDNTTFKPMIVNCLCFRLTTFSKDK